MAKSGVAANRAPARGPARGQPVGGRPGASPERFFQRWWGLVALCVGANLTETALVIGFDHGARPDLAPQASAVAPFGVFGDLRWVSVYHNSWVVLAGEVLAMLLVRGALTAVSTALAWPQHLQRPPARILFLRAVLATALAAVLLVPSVVLLFGLAAVPVSWLFLAAVPAALIVAFIVHPVGVAGDWWRRPVAFPAVCWVVAVFVSLSLASVAMAAAPVFMWPVISALSGVFNAWSWVGLVHGVVDRRPARYVVPMVPAAALAFVGLVIGGTLLGFDRARTARAEEGAPVRAPGGSGQPVLIVSGYGSSWDGRGRHPVPGDYLEEQFSYKGLGPGGRPLAYTGADTVKPVAQLDRMLLAQVASLHARTGKRVDVVAESEGALVAKTALLADPGAAVSTLVLASPLEDPGRVSYPISSNSGWGVATEQAMQLLSNAFEGVSPVDLSPDNPFLASLDQQAPSLETAVSCPINGIRQFALLPLADATVAPPVQQLPFRSVVLPAFHGGLLESAAGARVVSDVLAHRPVSDDELLRLADDVISEASGAWQVPSLVPSDYPTTTNGPADSSPSCRQVAASLRAALRARR